MPLFSIELNADILIIDERNGRSVAQEFNLRIIGLLGILVLAKKRGYIKFVKPVILELIKEHGFRVSKKLLNEILEMVNED